ncbi:MAG: extracellular solute-binding protein [Pseudobdellovibrionaceae bacterium]
MKKTLTTLVLTLTTLGSQAQTPIENLLIYTSQKEEFVKPIFDTFTKETGIKIEFISDKGPVLIERLKSEGSKTKADLLLTVDAGNLWFAETQGLLQPIKSATLEKNIPAQFRDPKNHWFGFTQRARTIIYNSNKVKPEELSTYEALAEKKWSKRLCLRTSKNVYNQSLLAVMLTQQTEAQVSATVQGWVSNLAAEPFADDTKMIEAIIAGQCDVGIANHYYLARIIKAKGPQPAGVFWANQKTTGVHVNIFGAGIIKASSKTQSAVQFLEWLSSDRGQTVLAENNLEFPLRAKIPVSKIIEPWGSFKGDGTALIKAGELQSKAVQLMDKVGYR